MSLQLKPSPKLTSQTQLCHTLCVTTQIPEDMGGASGRVAFIDTEYA